MRWEPLGSFKQRSNTVYLILYRKDAAMKTLKGARVAGGSAGGGHGQSPGETDAGLDPAGGTAVAMGTVMKRERF